MKIIYYCYGGAHSSITAANIHLGYLPSDRRPGLAEILGQPLFDRAEDHEIGDPVHMGSDEDGHQIYAIGLAGGYRVLAPALAELLRVEGVPPDSFRFEGTLEHAGVPLRVGGYTSRRLGLVTIGRPLCALGVWLHYQGFAEHVQRVRRLAPRSRGEVT